MNILIVNMSVDPVLGGGTVERTLKLAKELQKQPKTDVRVVSTTAGLDNPEALGSKFILLPCLNQRWYIPAPYFYRMYKTLKWADVVIIIGHWTLLNAMVFMVNKVTKRPYLFCPAGALHIFGRSGFFKRIYNALVGHAMVCGASRMIAIPQEEKELFYKLGVPKNKTSVIPNGISPEDFEYKNSISLRRQYRINDKPFLLFMGRLNEIKGPDIILDAFVSLSAEFKEWQLIFAGPDGGMQEQLEQTVLDKGLGNKVHIIGFVSGKMKSAAYHAAEILVIPSRLEAMSIVALEAGICGTPVVMTNECGFSELVEAKGGIEVPVDSIMLADSLKKLMLDADLIFQMGLNAKNFININYTWEIAAKKHRNLCEEVCQEMRMGRK